jgi:LysR family transcriptional regulator for metE and metH
MPRVSNIPLTDVLASLVQAHLGVGLVSRWAIASFELRGDVVARRFTRQGLPERWAAVYQKNQVEKLPLPRIARLIREHFSTIRASLAI